MGVADAALVLAWLVIIILLLGYAGLRRQMVEIQQQNMARNGAPTHAPEVQRVFGVGMPRIVMLSSDRCATCAELAPVFEGLAEKARHVAEHVVLKPSSVNDAQEAEGPLKSVIDPALYNKLYPGYVPALVLLDGLGNAVGLEPVGAREALVAAHDRFAAEIAASTQ